jgi:type IV secretory pathway TrbL component
MKTAKLIVVAAIVVSLSVLTGCSKDEGYRKTTGTVTMGGQPVAGASVMFYPDGADGEAGSALTDESGVYAATSSGSRQGGTGLKPGTYKVTVVKKEEVVDPDDEAFSKGEITYDELQQRKAKKGAYAKDKQPEMLTPKQYSGIATTPLSITVTDDPKSNVFDFNLE